MLVEMLRLRHILVRVIMGVALILGVVTLAPKPEQFVAAGEHLVARLPAEPARAMSEEYWPSRIVAAGQVLMRTVFVKATPEQELTAIGRIWKFVVTEQ